MKRTALVIVIIFVFLLSACHRHDKRAESWSSQKSSYQKTRDGYYTVRKGDSLHAIAFNYGMDWRDIAKWNGISAPYLIYPDQELRLSEPGGASSGSRSSDRSVVTTSGVGPTSGSTSSRSSESVPTTSGLKTPRATTRDTSPPPSSPAVSSSAPAVTGATSSGTKTTVPVSAGADPTKWLWPTEGRVVSNFKPDDPARNGIEIGGKVGQPVRSTAAGQVVYSGNGLIGYGELIIIKHSDRMLSAYAHNRKRLVSEGDQVPAGMKIAEMGRDDRNKAVLHFEIRINGEPENPLKFLPRQ